MIPGKTAGGCWSPVSFPCLMKIRAVFEEGWRYSLPVCRLDVRHGPGIYVNGVIQLSEGYERGRHKKSGKAGGSPNRSCSRLQILQAILECELHHGYKTQRKIY